VPIEDIALVVMENQQITITNGLLDHLISHGVAVVSCNQQHLPHALFMPLDGHSEQSERFRIQSKVSLPLKKNLWQQTITAKINNQADLLETYGVSVQNMRHWAKSVTSGDTLNHEARAAAYYWQHLFTIENFNRHQKGQSPNHLLNYGYAILRAITARALIGSGLHPTFGIFHRNKYNAYCLADDIMEPYRPFVDLIVKDITLNEDDIEELTVELKKRLLTIVAMDVMMDGKKSPLMVAMSRTTNSLFECYEGVSRKLLYPEHV
jgi:CRISPR-associated protein Cas1